MQRSHKKNHTGFFGESGTGKTTLAMKFIRNSTGCACCAPQKAPTVFLFDDEGEFAEILKMSPASTPEQLDAAVAQGWVCFDPHFMFPGEVEKALDFFCDFVLRVCDQLPGRKFIVIDELGLKVSGNAIPRPLKIIAQTGRRYGIDGVFMGQQLNELHNTVKYQLSELILFRTAEENALKFAKDIFKFPEAELISLPDYKWISRDKFGAESRG